MLDITFELYAKSRDKAVLKDGPANVRFWVKKSSKKMSLLNFDEERLKENAYKFVRHVLELNSNDYLRVVTFHYWVSQLRVSYWAFVLTSNNCYKCHAERALEPKI